MTDRPIIFSAPTIRALLDGRKTMTRRILKPQPDHPPGFDGWIGFSALCPARHYEMRGYDEDLGPIIRHRPLRFWNGDRIWVRENWGHSHDGIWSISDARLCGPGGALYAADGHEHVKWFPSIHMPREFSRLTLIVESVKVERLKDISESDASAEGFPLTHDGKPYDPPPSDSWQGYARASFYLTWSALHGPGSIEANPWVAAISFRVVKSNIDAITEAAP